MASKFLLEIVTPDRVFFEEEVEMVIVRTNEGDQGILRDHMKMVSEVAVGRIKIKKEGQISEAAIAGGFIKVDLDKTTILTDAAEWPDEIDPKRAMAAKQRAEERLKNRRDGINVYRAEVALNKALNRIQVYESFKR
ncbi:F0F1 ATP synthase subunit epsilon [Serpentinicella alkaliphila]|uniref:ATP synthase epsilon chain n=1 Tax=Serpentinicella alkaliphila TaxID=1734049 RepID=A0A4R2TK13_9FIRM|nr:F0F1 ATP synthase subunit epsilon [Serpentinicella alkaliphila]QUH24954.1 F0F1 ATP synthase subunit epsilon [Serpentinicella alkaliphila]TCQ02757.1 ATP synthase F1 subcomplex epsilon subunit [Serpentinicella alkaliphila]